MIVNGLRAFFKGELTLLFEKSVIIKSMDSSTQMFTVFLILVCGIAISLTFFLLLVATR